MWFLTENIAPMLVGIVASVMVWLYGGARGGLLIPVVPWFFVFMLEVLFCFPQREHGETTYVARERVWKSLKRDKLTWVALALFVILLIPFVNNGLCPNCDAKKIADGLSAAPPVPLIPFCVSRIDHLNVVLWFAVVLPSVLLIRHCLNDMGKRLVLNLIVWNGVAVAALGFVQAATGALGPFWCGRPGVTSVAPGTFFATFGYPNMAGGYFTLLFGIAVALWRDNYERLREAFVVKDISHSAPKRPRIFWKYNYFLIPAVIFYMAAVNTLSRAAIMLVTAEAVIFFFHTLILFLSRMPKVRRITIGVWSMILFGLVVFFALEYMPDNLQREVDSLGSAEVLDRVTSKGGYHARVSFSLWRDHKLFGIGGWGYAHLSPGRLSKLEKNGMVQGAGGINVHCDYLQFLCEHGLVGFGLMVAIAVLLIMPVGRSWRRLASTLRFARHAEQLPKPRQIFVLPSAVFCLLVAALTTLIHAFGDCPMRSIAILDVFFITLAAMPAFLNTKG